MAQPVVLTGAALFVSRLLVPRSQRAGGARPDVARGRVLGSCSGLACVPRPPAPPRFLRQLALRSLKGAPRTPSE
eukprot:5248811-Lingulodinium_polyedra.AAC.1